MNITTKKKTVVLPSGEMTISRSIRFTEREWDDAAELGKVQLGGIQPRHVVRMALREFLAHRGYNYVKAVQMRHAGI